MSIQKLINLCEKYLDCEEIDVNALSLIAYDMGEGFTVDDIIAYSKLDELKEVPAEQPLAAHYQEVINMIYNFDEDEENEVLSTECEPEE